MQGYRTALHGASPPLPVELEIGHALLHGQQRLLNPESISKTLRSSAAHLGVGHALLHGRQRLLPPLAVSGEAGLAVVVQPVIVGAVAVEVGRRLQLLALVALLQPTNSVRLGI